MKYLHCFSLVIIVLLISACASLSSSSEFTNPRIKQLIIKTHLIGVSNYTFFYKDNNLSQVSIERCYQDEEYKESRLIFYKNGKIKKIYFVDPYTSYLMDNIRIENSLIKCNFVYGYHNQDKHKESIESDIDDYEFREELFYNYDGMKIFCMLISLNSDLNNLKDRISFLPEFTCVVEPMNNITKCYYFNDQKVGYLENLHEGYNSKYTLYMYDKDEPFVYCTIEALFEPKKGNYQLYVE